MQPWIVICFVALAVAHEPAKSPEGAGTSKGKRPEISKQTKGANENTSNAAASPSPSNETSISSQQSAPPRPGGSTSKSNEDSQIQGRLETFTGLLVVVGFLQVGVLLMQWWIIRRQTALFSNSERAWLIITPRNWNPDLAAIDPKVAGPIPLNVFEATVKNIGRTPGQVIEIAMRYVTIGKLEDLPDIPDYGQTARPEGMLLVPQDSFGRVTPLSPSPSLEPEDTRAIRAAQRFVYAYGFVVYKDVFGNEHETRRGYVYDFPQGLMVSLNQPSFQQGGPPAYNRAT